MNQGFCCLSRRQRYDRGAVCRTCGGAGILRRHARVGNNEGAAAVRQIFFGIPERAALKDYIILPARVLYRDPHASYVPAKRSSAQTAESSRSMFFPSSVLILPSASTKK